MSDPSLGHALELRLRPKPDHAVTLVVGKFLRDDENNWLERAPFREGMRANALNSRIAAHG